MASLCLMYTGCKENKEDVEELDNSNVRTQSTEMITPSTDENATGTDAGSVNDGESGSMSGSTPGSARNRSGANADADSYSGDGSDGRTESTAVNRSKNVQVGTNNKKKNLKGYSAPDGTRDENNDGDMYTKHDTTMMPSGSTPIK